MTFKVVSDHISINGRQIPAGSTVYVNNATKAMVVKLPRK
jgi:hypothetical protein